MEIHSFTVETLRVRVFSSRAEMGAAAAAEASEVMRAAILSQGSARIILASAPSQDELIAGLVNAQGVDWSRVSVFHMDEYVGVSASSPASFRSYQQEHLLSHVKPRAFHGIRGEASDPEEVCERYRALLDESPIDLVCMGVGENGHIAFNDPPVADFADDRRVKVVELDEICRRQQVHDGCFPDLDSVPRSAITLTCPTLMSGRRIVCVVPGHRKAEAVAAMLLGDVSTSCPASILRQHPSATLYLDVHSASNLENEGFSSA